MCSRIKTTVFAGIVVLTFSTIVHADPDEAKQYGINYHEQQVAALTNSPPTEDTKKALKTLVALGLYFRFLLEAAAYSAVPAYTYDFDSGGGTNWTPAMRTTFTTMMTEANRRIGLLIPALRAYRTANPLNPAVKGDAKWDTDLTRLLAGLTQLQTDFAGTKQLEIEITALPPGKHAKMTDRGDLGWGNWDDLLELDPTWFTNADNTKKKKFPNGPDVNLRTLFHELTHLFGTDDDTAYQLDNAHDLERLFGEDIFRPSGLDQTKLFKILDTWRGSTRTASKLKFKDRPGPPD